MLRIECIDCQEQLGWMNDTGPCGFFYCDHCKEQNDEIEETLNMPMEDEDAT